ncbi:unnamed protein product [Spirodela intermedia]|uniref:HRDC domain-containing protein n=1 Tax=Spirodela intermedia TaxID=51605 RepID=A0A7I8JP46_SPIIN|nr:unnamed protein product [Spirodela intermedia]CAA6671929.1 unnamed protein product [Spirodela intermedia]
MGRGDGARIVTAVAISALAVAVIWWRRRREWRRSEEERMAEAEAEAEAAGPSAASLCYLELEKKPQNRFKRVLTDNSYNGFQHLKQVSMKEHPFEDKITYLLDHPPNLPRFTNRNEHRHLSPSYVWVSTEDQLESLAEILKKEQAFAVDTEQHSLRSFLGFTALMQISTQEHDFLLDTIALHDVMGILRPIFGSYSICKVFHGSDNDILWLQRDFHIYVINLFDTAKACLVLSKPQKSLAYLLENYCGVHTDKTLQREDWRMRPLSLGMVQYARTDAHYLLYIADCLVQELKTISHGMGPATCRSNSACLQLYSKDTEPSGMESTAASILSRYSNLYECNSRKSHEARELVRRLCIWRDLMARIHDESIKYVLSDQAIFYLGINAPQTEEEICDLIIIAGSSINSADVSPILKSPSHVVKTHMKELCVLIQGLSQSPEDIFRRILQMHLNPNGHCPISIYNYALLLELKVSSALFQKQCGGNPVALVGRKASRELFVQKFSCKAPVYHNCRIFASDGRLLCYSDHRKLEWYLRRGLAKIIENDPLPEDEDNVFYIQSKKNMCVGCGEKNHYLRYRIIPSCYRVHFPERLKSHRSHDIVLLCVDCHEIAHAAAEKYKRQVASEFKVPLFVRKVIGSGENESLTVASGLEEVGVSPLQLRTAAMALVRHGPKMPADRREELLKTVKTYFGGREISEQDLETVLLVGMSPRERRRLEKKRGLPIKPCEAMVGRKQMPCIESWNEKLTSSCAKQNAIEQERISICTPEDVESNDLPANDAGIVASSELHHITSSKRSKKVSLLGHGPHGKQVVEHLLKEQGDNGVLQFCQRWRQVFVDAIRPRFLPSGWDIMHRGWREFGEYSVYSSSHRDVDTIKYDSQSS